LSAFIAWCTQIISKETPYRSEQTEPFHSITLTIQNKASLEESLQALIEGDLLSGENKYQLPDGSKVSQLCHAGCCGFAAS
jgi:hypothetical protein